MVRPVSGSRYRRVVQPRGSGIAVVVPLRRRYRDSGNLDGGDAAVYSVVGNPFALSCGGYGGFGGPALLLKLVLAG